MTQKRPLSERRLDFGVAREACKHADRLLVFAAGKMSVHDGSDAAIACSDATEWCRECGAIRFAFHGRFIVPRRGRAR